MKNRYISITLVTGLSFATLIALAACAAAPTAVAPTEAAAAATSESTMAATAGAQIPNTGITSTTGVSGTVTLQLGQNATLGSYLTDGSGRTLYVYTNDTPDTSTCNDQCAQSWPPLLSSGQASVAGGLDATLLGTTQRTDGSTQVTYNHLPLYYYSGDQNAGDTKGQGFASVWYVLGANGTVVK